MGLSIWHLLVFIGIVILLFGKTRLPALGRALGQFTKELKKSSRGEEDIDITDTSKKLK